MQNVVGSLLTSLGFNEMMANSLTSPDYIKLSDDLKEEFNITMLNPLSRDLSSMRQSLLFSGLEALSYNINRRATDLKFYEIGKTYHKLPAGYEELKHLTLFLTGNKSAESWTNPQRASDFFMFKGYVEAVLARFGLEKAQSQPSTSDVFAEGIALFLGPEKIVDFGTVKKSIAKAFDIKQEVFYADFNWNAILKLVGGKIKFAEIPKYPEVRRDLALLVDQSVQFESIYKIARQTEKSLLKKIDLFDVYEGKNLPEGKKSYAIGFTIQDPTKTLTDVQIDKIMLKLQHNFETELNAVLR
jgi:phenylalanyl-tRNA synthetase beta chain